MSDKLDFMEMSKAQLVMHAQDRRIGIESLQRQLAQANAVIAEQKEKHAAIWKSLIEDNNYLRGELNAARARVATEG